MARIVKTFRIEKSLVDRVEAQSENFSEAVRLYIIAGLYQMALPRQAELEHIVCIEEQIRRAGINLNQAARVLNAEFAGGNISDGTLKILEDVVAELKASRVKIDRLIATYYGK